MIELGYSLSSEEHPPRDLVGHAVAAEEAGFSFALVSVCWVEREILVPAAVR